MYAPQTAKQITENNVTVCDTGIYDSSSVAYDGTEIGRASCRERV